MHLTTEAGDPVAPVLFEEDSLGLAPNIVLPEPLPDEDDSGDDPLRTYLNRRRSVSDWTTCPTSTWALRWAVASAWTPVPRRRSSCDSRLTRAFSRRPCSACCGPSHRLISHRRPACGSAWWSPRAMKN